MSKKLYLTGTIAALISMAVTFQSCNNCTGLCLNGGDCVDGFCECSEGYSGTNCEILDCSGNYCSNGQRLVENNKCSCKCNVNYKGDSCNVSLSQADYIGTYSYNEACHSSSYSGTFTISAGTSNNTLVLTNFSHFNITSSGTISASGISLQNQTTNVGGSNIYFSNGHGDFDYDKGELIINYSYKIGSQSTKNCEVSCTKQ